MTAPGPWIALSTSTGSRSLRFRALPWPLAVHQLSTLEVRIEPETPAADEAAPLSRPALQFDAVMPAHRHGMTTTPVVTEGAPGEFAVEGVLLHMPGDWELHFDVLEDGTSERATFALELPHGSDPANSAVLSLSPLGAVPPDPTNRFADDPRAVRLGERVFREARWSQNGEVSCATCHDPQQAFTDGRALGQGIAPLSRHTLTLWNVAYQRWWFWDGRADTLWSQAVQPLLHPAEIGATFESVRRTLTGDPTLEREYTVLFGPPTDHDDESLVVHLGKALAAYERTLVLADSPFDRHVAALRRGDRAGADAAMSPAARRGLALFVGRAGCIGCHNGPLLSDGEFHDILLAEDPSQPRDPGRYRGIDELRASPYRASSRHSDAPSGEAARRVEFLARSPDTFGRFRTPSLRNVALTAPYLHDGRFATLAEVLHHYSTLEGARAPHHPGETILAPLDLSPEEVADLVAFLESLTGRPAAR